MRPVIICVSILVLIGAYFLLRAPQSTSVSAELPEAAATLVVENENAISWIALNNTFTEDLVHPDHPQNKRLYRTGLLLQIGTHGEADSKFESVTFEKDGAALLSLDSDAFSWINVVGALETTGDFEPDPMEPAQAFYLYPNEDPGSDPCAPLLPVTATGPQDPTVDVFYCLEVADCGSPAALTPGCLRGRTIHADFQTNSILTYWQGTAGYRMTSRQEAGTDNRDNRLVFDLIDPVTVRVYAAAEIDDEWTMIELQESRDLLGGPGVVDRIVIESTQKTGPQSGMRQDPPWPTKP